MTPEMIWDFLKDIPDPEIPVIDIVELGIIREVNKVDEGAWEVVVTPTYSGCPAMDFIQVEIKEKLKEKGLKDFRVRQVLRPAWTTDWISDEAKEKLKKFGIAPPEGKADKLSLLGQEKHVECPLCSSRNTELVSAFGSTPCKSLHKMPRLSGALRLF